ncbi:hypothetical protein [Nocardia pseudovaccinii]|uniref:hypothetical protein n=1 Tax=Nocardia pseudovaccinii TaxID=189540 RepID=UPI000A4F24A4|nr:hypothetical protein [Nocardia pseudovaccinii]
MTLLRRLITLTAIATGTAAMTFAAPGSAAAGPAPIPAPAVPAATAPAAQAAAGDLFAGYRAVVEALRTFGIDPFLYPAVAPFCSDTGSLGLVPAVAGAVPGPWPKTTVAIPGLDPAAVKAGQVMFTFVPYGLGADGTNASGMNVAWVNLANGRSGITAMGSISDVVRTMVPAETPAEIRPLAERAVQDFFAIFPVGGVRAVPVDTGSGTVLAAVFGAVDNGTKSCFFLPTIGLTTVR